ncbi:MAG: hypothetical protein A2V69_00235 [Candidatus Portnoybacteria bacterium RBG_13_40_8]|uniref:Methyltransferase domain-containing protein n=1 Tax=Candidatus Portnoybacteria bacterium RBG_13_40_8 TaxID=1801990 RepID=A0A1G2F3I4_9BACT|nr:MAG: hypothetical protein A2V69_00235 [Candidatus Portnoybacteria bacterium RBG_13_40_8]
MKEKKLDSKLEKEAQSFDDQIDERLKHGFIPDLRRLKKIDWFYNNVWRDPELVKIFLMPTVNYIIDHAKLRGGKILEIGCGCGYLTLELARNNMDVTGIDLSPGSIEIANQVLSENAFKENFGSLKYICTGIHKYDLGNQTFDTIIFFGTLHHMPDPALILRKVHRALKQGGQLIIYEPIKDNISKDSAFFAAIFRALVPTWIGYDLKLKNLDNPESWKKYVEEIYKEYTFSDEHEQSPFDNSTSSEEAILGGIRDIFDIKTVEYFYAFVDKLIGGIRGDDRIEIAKFLMFLDAELIRKKIMKPSTIRIFAIKR